MPWLVHAADGEAETLTFPEILKGLRAGELSGETLVWRRGAVGWQTLSQVPDFLPYLESLEEDEPTRR